MNSIVIVAIDVIDVGLLRTATTSEVFLLCSTSRIRFLGIIYSFVYFRKMESTEFECRVALVSQSWIHLCSFCLMITLVPTWMTPHGCTINDHLKKSKFEYAGKVVAEYVKP